VDEIKLKAKQIKRLNRLLESRESIDIKLLIAGYDAGKHWARHFAEFEHLERLDCVREKIESLDRGDSVSESFGGCSPGESFLSVIAPVVSGDQSAVDDFWDAVIGVSNEARDDDTFVAGFAHGVLKRWDELNEH